MSILEYNGAAIIAVAGKDCVGIAARSTLGRPAPHHCDGLYLGLPDPLQTICGSRRIGDGRANLTLTLGIPPQFVYLERRTGNESASAESFVESTAV